MRLHFNLSPNRQPVPFSYPHLLTGCFHAWSGKDNALHDTMSLYSLGWLQGGKARGEKLDFPFGARWFISAPDTTAGQKILESLAQAALQAPSVCCGMEVVEIYGENTPEFGPRRFFRAASPIFLRGEEDSHLLYDDPRANAALTHAFRNKLEAAGLGHLSQSAKMSFDASFQTPKTRLVHIKDGACKRANVCPVIVEGEPEAVRFAWNVGAGNLCGSGFGSLI